MAVEIPAEAAHRLSSLDMLVWRKIGAGGMVEARQREVQSCLRRVVRHVDRGNTTNVSHSEITWNNVHEYSTIVSYSFRRAHFSSGPDPQSADQKQNEPSSPGCPQIKSRMSRVPRSRRTADCPVCAHTHRCAQCLPQLQSPSATCGLRTEFA